MAGPLAGLVRCFAQQAEGTASIKGEAQLKKKKNWVEEGHLTPETDHPAETGPTPGQVALRPYSDSLIREQQAQRENCSKIKSTTETAAW